MGTAAARRRPAGSGEAAAFKRYPYEAGGTPFRGLVFHEEPWHWAMLTIYGEHYWVERPELVHPPAEYRPSAEARYSGAIGRKPTSVPPYVYSLDPYRHSPP